MKYVINLLVIALIAFLAYVLYTGIREPIEFRAEKEKRKNVVVDRLEDIRTAQEIHREIRGGFAGNFDDLKNVLSTDSIPFFQLLPDPADPENPDKFIRNTIYTSAADSIQSLGINLDEIRYVPYTERSAQFEMMADTTTYQQTLVPVMECFTRWKIFMGSYADPRFRQYDDTYDPDKKIGFGSMTSPNLEGNWN